MTYGALMAEAKRQLHAALAEPITLHSAEDAAAASYARALLYRVAAGGIALHLDLPGAAGRHRFLHYRGDGIKGREATLLGHLREDLLAAAWVVPDPGQASRPASGTSARLARAADAAGAAFDLLAGHLRPVDVQPVDVHALQGSAPLRRGGTRITAQDAVLLARTLARLDSRLEQPVRELARHAGDDRTRHRLIAVADDCKRVTHQGVRQFASVIHDILRRPAERLVDSLDIAQPAVTWPPAPTSPSAAADLVADLRSATRRWPDRLSVLDLAAVASVGSRVCLLTAYATASLGGPTGDALTAARQWREVFQNLSRFATRSRGRHLVSRAQRFRNWVEELVRPGRNSEFSHATTWVPTIQAMTTDLADIAYAVDRALATKLDTSELLLPFDPGTRGREHLFRAAKPSEEPVVRLRQATDRAHRSSRELAQAVHDIDPAAHPYPTRARKAWRRPAPKSRADTVPTPPPSRQPPPAIGRRR